MKNYQIIGPNIEIDINHLKREYEENNKSLVIIGDSKNLIDCNSINVPKNANIIIQAHGFKLNKQNHIMDLCINKDTNSYDTTTAILKKMFGNKNPVHIALYSCYSGAASESIEVLAEGSTLMTFDPKDKVGAIESNNEAVLRSVKFDFLPGNPFAKFIQLLFITPSDNKFTLRTKAGSVTFTSSLNSLVDYSENGIKVWQQKELSSFTNFCRLHQKNTTPLIKEQIYKFLEMLEGSLSQNWHEHNIERYQELLLINLAVWGKIVEVKKLLSLKININAVTQGNESALMLASNQGHYEVVQLLIKQGADLNIASRKGVTPLYSAVTGGHYEVVKLLVKAGTNKEALSFSRYPALFEAAGRGHYEIVEYLIENGANKNFIAENGANALYYASVSGHDTVVEYLANEGLDINIKLLSEHTPLSDAAFLGFIKVVKVLLNKGVNVNIMGEKNSTALYVAAQQGFKEIVDILIKAKSDVNAETNEGFTGLFVASFSNHLEVVKLLLAAGANTQVNYKGMLAIELTESEEIKKEIKVYEEDILSYILTHNKQAQYALNAFNNLKMTFPKAKGTFTIVEECLEAQDQYENINLNNICGIDGSYYHDEL